MSGFAPPPELPPGTILPIGGAPGARLTSHDTDQRGTCCQCHNTLANGGHEHCQRVARQALERMNEALRMIYHETQPGYQSWLYVEAAAKRGLGIPDE